MAEPQALPNEAAPSTPALAQERPLDPILVAARERGLHMFRLLGTATAVLGLVTVLPWILQDAPTTASPWVGMVLALVFGIASWFVPARWHGLAAGFLLGAVGLVAVLGTWSIGPTFTMGSLYVVVPLLAAFFFGKRLILPAAIVTALVLAGIGVVSWLSGNPVVGTIDGPSVPYLVYVRLCVTTFSSVAIALAFVHAALSAMETSIARYRAAARVATEEQERRVAAERELARAQRMEEIGRLASGVAHDTKNALVVLSAGVKELRATVRGPDEQAVLADLEHAVANVNGTVQQLLSLARRHDSPARAVSLAKQLSHFASAVRRVLPPEVQLEVDCRSDAQAVLDPVRLEQALLNLALNARDAMPGGGRLTLRLREEDGDGDGRAVVEVEDSGTGMDAATSARMFEPFFTTKPEGAGTGLGLHMVRAFVDGAGGTIQVDSAVGRGTRIALAFPVTAAKTAIRA
jgi:signal transduction histidine kinase